MELAFSKERHVDIFVDAKKNLAFFSFVINPDYKFGPDSTVEPLEWPPKAVPMFYSKTALELKYPYTTFELAETLEKGIDAWNKLEPYTSKRGSIEEYYYKVNGFKRATIGKKLIRAGWNDLGEKSVSVSLPVKAGKYYLGIEHVMLHEDADWEDFANAVIKFVEMDITKTRAYQVYKRKLNVL